MLLISYLLPSGFQGIGSQSFGEGGSGDVCKGAYNDLVVFVNRFQEWITRSLGGAINVHY